MARDGTKWTGERIAHLGFLWGMGYTAEEIAQNAELGARSRNNTFRQMGRFGLFRRQTLIENRGRPRQVFAVEAAKRGITAAELFRRLLATMAKEPNLIGAVLDDGK